jgi:hypothetical protein
MNRYHLIESFFSSQEEYIDFLNKGNTIIKSNDEQACLAELKHHHNYFSYTLIWLKDGKFIGDEVIVFDSSLENVDTFNRGCKIIADRLAIYIDKNNPFEVPDLPPAFGDLTYKN